MTCDNVQISFRVMPSESSRKRQAAKKEAAKRKGAPKGKKPETAAAAAEEATNGTANGATNGTDGEPREMTEEGGSQLKSMGHWDCPRQCKGICL